LEIQMDFNKIKYEESENIAYVGFGHNNEKSMTVLDLENLKEFSNILDLLEKNQSDLRGVIFHSVKNNVFLAGADINLIHTLDTESEAAAGADQGQKLMSRIDDLRAPTVACIDGPCLGGGLELALSCDYILASDSKKTILGLPEVKLGILPGFGGTYRLPRKIGLPKSLDLILSGKTLNGKKAKKIGLIEDVCPKERLLDYAPNFFTKDKDKSSFKSSIEHFASDNFLSRKLIFQKARESVLKKTKGFYHAPLKILDLIESGAMKKRDVYLELEAKAFGQLCASEQSKNLRNLFFLMESSKKYPGQANNVDVTDLDRGAVVGAGTMGGGIAWLMASNNMMPIMKDLNLDALELGLKQSASNFSGAVKRRKMSRDDFERKQRSITAQMNFNGFMRVDLLIEAIVENMDIKKSVFSELEDYVREDSILTSNTSSLSIEEMSTSLKNPSRFAGLHFFNPVHRMPLVEIITHEQVSPKTVELLYKWALKAKKTPIIVKDGPGFLVNRILMPYLNEVGYLLEEGVPIKNIEKACINFGMPMGPCRLLDEIGIDVGVKVAKILHDGLGDRAKGSTHSGLLAEKNFLGKKTGKGFYNYDKAGKEIGLNEDALSLLPKNKKEMDETEIQMRVFLPMINEAAYILDEGIVENSSVVDLGLIFGIGFPPFRGGLLRYADSEGLDRILNAIQKFSTSVDEDRYRPSKYLINLVESNQNFYS